MSFFNKIIDKAKHHHHHHGASDHGTDRGVVVVWHSCNNINSRRRHAYSPLVNLLFFTTLRSDSDFIHESSTATAATTAAAAPAATTATSDDEQRACRLCNAASVRGKHGVQNGCRLSSSSSRQVYVRFCSEREFI